MKIFSTHRWLAGIGIALCYLAGAFLIKTPGDNWPALALVTVGIVGEVYVLSSPYRHILRFALPWHAEQPDMDEREGGLRSFAYETSYMLAICFFLIVFGSVYFAMEFGFVRDIFWFVAAFAACLQMLPTLVLEWIGPGGSLVMQPED